MTPRLAVRVAAVAALATLAVLTGCASAPTGGPAPAAGQAPGERVPAHRLPAAQLVEHLLAVADREWRDWGQTTVDATDGHSRVERRGAVETDAAWLPPPEACDASKRLRRVAGCHHAQPFDAVARLRRYWVAGLGPDSEPARDPVELERVVREEPWSAVFVSYLMQEVGLSREAFPFDDTHSNYLRGLAGSPQFERLLARETPLAAGDLVCGPRNRSRDPALISLQRMNDLDDLQVLRGSHCDLVVAVDRHAREARVVGGNVADSVAMTRIATTADGRAIRTLSRPWFVLVRPR